MCLWHAACGVLHFGMLHFGMLVGAVIVGKLRRKIQPNGILAHFKHPATLKTGAPIALHRAGPGNFMAWFNGGSPYVCMGHGHSGFATEEYHNIYV